MAYNRQKYIDREYDRLITQAKKLYNEMSLGGVLKEKTPSFEKILNYAGTKSGLKRPTLKSLKALRKLQDEGGILWGVEQVLPKKEKAARVKLKEIRTGYEQQQKAIKKAKSRIKKEFPDINKVPRKQQEEFFHNILGPVSGLLDDLRYYKNYCKTNLDYIDTKAKLSEKDKQKYRRNNIGFMACDWCIKHMKDILSSADSNMILNLSQRVLDYFNKHGHLQIDEVYEGLTDLKNTLVDGVYAAVKGSEQMQLEPETDMPMEVGPEIKELQAPAAIKPDTEGVTLENVFDSDLWSQPEIDFNDED